MAGGGMRKRPIDGHVSSRKFIKVGSFLTLPCCIFAVVFHGVDMNRLTKFGVPVALLGAASASFAQTAPADALSSISGLSTSSAGFGPVMFGLAAAVVGIMIGVKWIKRARSAG